MVGTWYHIQQETGLWISFPALTGQQGETRACTAHWFIMFNLTLVIMFSSKFFPFLESLHPHTGTFCPHTYIIFSSYPTDKKQNKNQKHMTAPSPVTLSCGWKHWEGTAGPPCLLQFPLLLFHFFPDFLSCNTLNSPMIICHHWAFKVIEKQWVMFLSNN